MDTARQNVVTPTATDLLSLHDYLRQYEQDGPFEIIDDERVPIMSPVFLHNVITSMLYRLLYAHCMQHQLGEVYSEMPFVLTYRSNWVKGARVPDVMFIAQQRWQEYIAQTPDYKQKPIILVPDLAVEVVSPNDLYSDLQKKVSHYRKDGVKQIWVVDPQSEQTTVYMGQQYTIHNRDDMLTGGALLADFAIKLDDLFALNDGDENR